MYFRNKYVKYGCIVIFSSCISLVTTLSLNNKEGIQLQDIVHVSNFYTLGSTGTNLEKLIVMII